MTSLLAIVTTLALAAIVLGWLLPGSRWLATIGGCVLFYLAGLIAWWFAVYFQVVPVDRILAMFNIDRAGGAMASLFFGPPLLPAAAFLILRARYSQPRPQASQS